MKKMTATEQMIADTLKSSIPGEQIRVQLQPRNLIMGYAIEVTRELKGEEYSYYGWVSAKVVQTNCEPWPQDQRQMIERAFQTTIKEIMN